MLKKLIKYDLKDLCKNGRWCWSAAAITTVLLIITIHLAHRTENGIWEFLASMQYMIISGLLIFPQICIYLRYHKNFATDEAYLTFTLPVKRWELLLSKTIVALIEAFIRYFSIFIMFLLITIFEPPYDGTNQIINTNNIMSILRTVCDAFNELGIWLIVYVIIAVLFMVVLTVLMTSVIYIAISFGFIVAKKAKKFVTFGILYMLYVGFGFVFPLSLAIPTVLIVMPIVEKIAALPTGHMRASICVALLLLLCVISAITSIIYFINQGILERKLNLQ